MTTNQCYIPQININLQMGHSTSRTLQFRRVYVGFDLLKLLLIIIFSPFFFCNVFLGHYSFMWDKKNPYPTDRFLIGAKFVESRVLHSYENRISKISRNSSNSANCVIYFFSKYDFLDIQWVFWLLQKLFGEFTFIRPLSGEKFVVTCVTS